MGKYTEFMVPLKALTPGEHTYNYHLGKEFFKNMESADIRDANVETTLTVNMHNDVYQLHFTVSGEVTVLCDRCLDEMQLPVDASYDVTVKYGDAYRDDSDEVLEIPSTANDLNVAYMIFDTVSLSIPIKHVHPLGKCNRQMSAMLKKHRVSDSGDPDINDELQLIDEMDDVSDDSDSPKATDPRWDALKGLSTDD